MNMLEGAALFAMAAHEVRKGEREGLEKAAVIVETAAKRAIGTYAFEWAPLAESTLRKKAADTPLLETGALRDSIEHNVEGRSAFIGTNSQIGVWQDKGTSRIPPRPFLLPAALHNEEAICRAVGDAMFKML